MKENPDDEARAERIRSEAAEWFVASCEAEIGSSSREIFDRWLKSSPEHLRAYLRMSAMWESADLLQNAAPLPAVPTLRRTWTVSQLRFGLAACLILACGAVACIAWWRAAQVDSYSTAAAERRTVRLPDGSIIQLNARSGVEVDFSSAQRDVTLSAGQALFAVAKNAQRPFVVHVGELQFKAIGTRFDIYRKPGGATITVVDGQVAVRSHALPPLLVSAGEQAKLGQGAPRVAYKTNVISATSWTEGTLVFAATPLQEIVEEYNRTTARQLVVEDPDLLQYHISGSFPAADPAAIVKFLQRRFGVAVHETSNEIRISAPAKH